MQRNLWIATPPFGGLVLALATLFNWWDTADKIAERMPAIAPFLPVLAACALVMFLAWLVIYTIPGVVFEFEERMENRGERKRRRREEQREGEREEAEGKSERKRLSLILIDTIKKMDHYYLYGNKSAPSRKAVLGTYAVQVRSGLDEYGALPKTLSDSLEEVRAYAVEAGHALKGGVEEAQVFAKSWDEEKAPTSSASEHPQPPRHASGAQESREG